MEIQFLGTSSGTPTKTRNVSGLALRADGSRHWHLVDCGEGTQHRLLHTGLSLMHLRAIFITHMHGDHCYGLPGLLASAGMLKRNDAMLIMGPRALRRYVDGVMEATQLRLPYPLDFIAVEDMTCTDALPDLAVQTVALSHRVPSWAYSFTEKAVEYRLDVEKLERDGIPRGPLWGMMQQGRDAPAHAGAICAADYLLPQRQPRKIVVGGDNDDPSLLAGEVRDAALLIHEATYTEDILQRVGPGPQHSSALRVAQFAAEARVPNLILTHFSPRYQQQEGVLSLSGIASEAREAYHGRLFLANDLDRFILDKQGNVSRTS